LIKSALSPFDYLRENLVAIAEVSIDGTGATTPRAIQEGLPTTSNSQILQILIRELARTVFIFFPMLLLVAGIYSLLAQPMLNALAPKQNADWITYFWSGRPSWIYAVEVALGALRWLLLGMTGKFLIQSFLHADEPSPKIRKLLVRCNVLVGALFLALVTLPFLDSVWHLGPVALHGLAAFLNKFHDLSPGPRHDSDAAMRWLHLRIAFAPLGLRLFHVLGYVGLATLTYLINRFLTTAIGDLAVYLGADTLSTNFVARSQIMEECTQTVLELLGSQHDLIPNHTPSNYDRIIIAAHSLGSVIAYDTLNDLMAQNMAFPPLRNKPSSASQPCLPLDVPSIRSITSSERVPPQKHTCLTRSATPCTASACAIRHQPVFSQCRRPSIRISVGCLQSKRNWHWTLKIRTPP
jgi:hypothetical protein